MYLGSKVLGHIVSEHSELQLWGATLSTIFFVSSARSAEAGLHHGLDRLIEHVITKIGNNPDLDGVGAPVLKITICEVPSRHRSGARKGGVPPRVVPGLA
jgi:hypothetical protein